MEIKRYYTVETKWFRLQCNTEEDADIAEAVLRRIEEGYAPIISALEQKVKSLEEVAQDFNVALSGADHNDTASFSRQSPAEEWAEWVCKRWEGVTATLTVKGNPRLNKRYRNGKWESI